MNIKNNKTLNNKNNISINNINSSIDFIKNKLLRKINKKENVKKSKENELKIIKNLNNKNNKNKTYTDRDNMDSNNQKFIQSK